MVKNGKLITLCGLQKDFNGTFRALMHFRTQILNTTGKIGGNCQGGAKNGGFNNEEKRGHSGGKTLRKVKSEKVPGQ